MNRGIVFILFFTAISVCLFMLIYLDKKPVSFILPPVNYDIKRRYCLSTDETKQVFGQIIDLAREIKYAKQHVRGTKTGDSLIRATGIMSDIVNTFKLDFESITERTVSPSENVCPEKYMGPKIGYPFYYTGFIVDNCTYAKPLESLITVLINFKQRNAVLLQELVQSIWNYKATLSIIINTFNIPTIEFNKYLSQYKHVSFTTFSGNEGSIWNKMIAQVKTPYVSISRDVSWFNHDSRFDRLIRQIERLNLSVAGGSFRNATGHWFIGCQQRVYRNFTLVYEAGYDESKEGCQFCDHIDGPFVTKTDILSKTKLDETITGSGLFEDFFLRTDTSEKVVCPDSMFFTNISERSYKPKDWKSFSKLRQVNTIKFSGKEIQMACTSYPRYIVPNSALSPCSQKELADLLVTGMNLCDKIGILCELDTGSVMGALKFHSVLPWEKDADIVFISANYSAINAQKNSLKKQGYKLQSSDTRSNKESTRSSAGYFCLKSSPSNWCIEMWGMRNLGSETEINNNQPQTRVNVNGHWVGMIRNPSLFARNRYGKEIYHHAQHWSATGLKNSWLPYKTNFFKPCGVPGHQACLDRFNPDGNLQFRDPIP